ncbi:MAG: hypothetical protein SVX43_00585 [Cyanobacteriota bacterium]|nr:hypothetical protein [Cyanobacteriota bacterium]
MSSLISGILDSSDGSNPTRNGRYYDDYLLTNLANDRQVQLNLDGTFDPYLQLINAETGEIVTYNDDGGPGLNSQLTFTVENAVDYIVRATSFASGATGSYDLSTTVGNFLVLTDTIHGIFDSSDGNNLTRNGRYHDDYILNNLAIGQQVQINLDGAFDTYLQLINAETGEIIAYNDDGGPGLNSQLTFTVERGVDYIVRPTSYRSGAMGEYGLTTTGGRFLALTDTINGVLDSSDDNNPTRNGSYHDEYVLDDLTVGQQVQITLDGAFDPYLQLINADTGAVIAYNDDSNSDLNPQLTFTVQSGMNYAVRVTSYDSGVTGEYGLTTTAGSFSSVSTVPDVPATYRPFDASQVFNLNSNSNADRIIYLDFDGHTTTGTRWNDNYGSRLLTPAYDTDGNVSSFSNTELENIWQIWQRVAEDFSPFNVNVTTQAPSSDRLIKSGGSDTQWGIRVAVGGSSSDWFRRPAGGVAYLNSFNWSTDTPAFVFENNLGNGNEKFTAEAISHEVGHTLGLSHDGTSKVEYYRGRGKGETGWAPIMGAGYYRELTQWSRGEYKDAGNQQDDLDIITGQNGFGYRADDHSDTLNNASTLLMNGDAVETYGIIERNTDYDWFSFTTTGNIDLDINAFDLGPNLDILAQLYDSSGQLVQSSNPTNSLSAGFSTSLNAGQYFLSVTGTGQGLPATGYSDYGSLGQYSITGTIV